METFGRENRRKWNADNECWKNHDKQDSHLCLCACFTHTMKPTKREGAKYCIIEPNLIHPGLLAWVQYCDNQNLYIDFSQHRPKNCSGHYHFGNQYCRTIKYGFQEKIIWIFSRPCLTHRTSSNACRLHIRWSQSAHFSDIFRLVVSHTRDEKVLTSCFTP